MRKAILLSVLFAIPVMASAFNGKAKVGGIWYNIVTKAEKAEVTSEYPIQHYKGRVVIPKTIVYEGVTCNVTAIGEGAFAQSEIQQVVIPSSVTSIGSRAFVYCDNLNSVTIPESIEEIGSRAFDGCYALKTIKLPSKLKTIEEGLFNQCYQLTSIVIPNDVTTIGWHAFKGCRGLKSVKMGDKIEKIGDEAFMECEQLSQVEIPNSVVEIESNAFKDCKRLTTVTLGSGVEKISFSAFSGCGDLKDFYITSAVLPDIINHAEIFQDAEVEYATLHVAESMIETCKLSAPWSKFGKIVANPNAVAPRSAGNNQEDDETIYEPSDCQGQFPTPAIPRYELENWLEEQAIYPKVEEGKYIGTSVTVDFVVEPDGSISNVKATKNSWPELIPEAERVVRSMPKWHPGKVNGKYARVRERIGVHFKK